jgi:hypothetical protein
LLEVQTQTDLAILHLEEGDRRHLV